MIPIKYMVNVASLHGGDGGNDPPHGHNHRIPTSCQSSKCKKTRSVGRSLNLYEAFKKNGNKPLPLEYSTTERQFRAVGDNYQMYVRKISQEVDSEVPYHYSSWKNVDAKYKKAILATIAHYFDMKSFQNTEHWDAIKEGIQVECASRFKDRKAGMKKHFDKHGGYKDVEEAKKHPPESMNPEAWCKLIDGLFTTPAYMNRSEKNKANRSKQLYGSYHGSQSLADRRHKEVKETGLARYVKGWKEMHYKKGKWINENAKHALENIEEEYNRSLSCSGGDEMEVDQVGCLKKALGTRHSHLRGVGRVLKSVTPELFPNVNRDVEDERWRKQEEANEKLQKDNAALKAQMKHILKLVLPGSSFPLEEEDDQEEEQEEEQEDQQDDEFV